MKKGVQQKPFFSIVIPTLNEEKYLPRLLTDLRQQTWQDFEVVHIDGNSEDATVAKAQEFAKYFSITTKGVKKRNVAFQRNTGGKLAQGKWIIFMDADNQLVNNFLADLQSQLTADPDIDVFTTWMSIEDNVSLNKAMETAINLSLELYSRIGSLYGRVEAVGALIGANQKVLQEVSFPEKEKIFEDSFFVNECVEKGFAFKIFRQPRYVFSLRRVKREGSLKMMRIVAKAQLNYILGKSFSDEHHGYVMKGGAYYDEQPQSPLKLPLKNLQKFIEKASDKQLVKAKKIFRQLKKELQL